MVAQHILTHGLFYAAAVNAYLFIIMITTSPRVWGYADYPEVVKDKVPPQTKSEKWIAVLIGLPWFIFALGYPILSTYGLRAILGSELPFWTAFINIFTLVMLASLVDLVVLDWLIVSRITPKFVIIPGSEAADYKEFSHHYKGHARAVFVLVILSLILAGILSWA